MSYESSVATYFRLREEHKGDSEAQRIIAEYGLEVALRRVADVLHTSAIAHIVIEGVRNKSKRQPNGFRRHT